MKKILKYTFLSILSIIAFSFLILTLSCLIDNDLYINNLNQFTSEETFYGIKNSFDTNVIPAFNDSITILKEGLTNPGNVLDEFDNK